jgi:hypothetical protein
MQIARPPSGFKIVERPAATALLNASASTWPRLANHWAGIKLRLSFTGHREGVLVPSRKGWRLFVDDGDENAGLPRVKVIYLPLGDTICYSACKIDPLSRGIGVQK